jgi:hypothetical protein
MVQSLDFAAISEARASACVSDRPAGPPTGARGRLLKRRHTSFQSPFGSFGEACRTSSRGRLFRVRSLALQQVEIELRLPLGRAGLIVAQRR